MWAAMTCSTVTRKRLAARQRFVENTCQRVDVDRRCRRLLAEPLRRHVIEAADVIARHCQPGVTASFGDAEVHQVREIVRRDNDVLRLDVAMDQPFSMGSI